MASGVAFAAMPALTMALARTAPPEMSSANPSSTHRVALIQVSFSSIFFSSSRPFPVRCR